MSRKTNRFIKVFRIETMTRVTARLLRSLAGPSTVTPTGSSLHRSYETKLIVATRQRPTIAVRVSPIDRPLRRGPTKIEWKSTRCHCHCRLS